MLSARSPLPIAAFAFAALTAVSAGLYLHAEHVDSQRCVYPARTNAAPAALAAQNIPDHFAGSFLWDGSDVSQRVALDVHETREEQAWNGETFIVATGRGAYIHGRDAHFDFEMRINKATRDFTMTESNPNVSSGFVTNGAHKGVARDERKMVARWTSFTDGAQGTLTISASGHSTRPQEVRANTIVYTY